MNNQQDTLFDLTSYSNRRNSPVGDWHRDVNAGFPRFDEAQRPQIQIQRNKPPLTPDRVREAAADWTLEQLQDAIAQLNHLLQSRQSTPVPLQDVIDQRQIQAVETLEDWHLGYQGHFTLVQEAIRIQITPEPVQLTVFERSQSLELSRELFRDKVEGLIEQRASQCKNLRVIKVDSLTQGQGVRESTSSTSDTTTGHQSPIDIYTPRGSSRTKHQYFRYRYRDGGKLQHCHIPGGNITTLTARARHSEVENWVKAGKSPGEIVNLIKSWGKCG